MTCSGDEGIALARSRKPLQRHTECCENRGIEQEDRALLTLDREQVSEGEADANSDALRNSTPSQARKAENPADDYAPLLLPFAFPGQVTVWDPIHRSPVIGPRAFGLAPGVPVTGLAAGVYVTIAGYVEPLADPASCSIVTRIVVE